MAETRNHLEMTERREQLDRPRLGAGPQVVALGLAGSLDRLGISEVEAEARLRADFARMHRSVDRFQRLESCAGHGRVAFLSGATRLRVNRSDCERRRRLG